MITWEKHSRLETWAARTSIGIVTVSLRPAAGGFKTWTALGPRGLRIATGRDAAECMANAEAQIVRLANQARAGGEERQG